MFIQQSITSFESITTSVFNFPFFLHLLIVVIIIIRTQCNFQDYNIKEKKNFYSFFNFPSFSSFFYIISYSILRFNLTGNRIRFPFFLCSLYFCRDIFLMSSSKSTWIQFFYFFFVIIFQVSAENFIFPMNLIFFYEQTEHTDIQSF